MNARATSVRRGGVWSALLWKEWRDHRGPLVAFALALPLLAALGVWLLPESQGRSPTIPTFASYACLLIVALTLIADLIPGEEQRGTIALLRRLPGGLARVFVTKLLFALAVSAVLCAIAYVATTTASALLRGAPWFPSLQFRSIGWLRNTPMGRWELAWWPAVALLVAWIFAVSTWLPRGALALPAAAIALALFLAPILLVLERHPGLGVTTSDFVLTWRVLFVGAPLVAGVSFVLGRRRGGGLGASAWRGLLATLVLMSPAYARAAWRIAWWDRIDPTSASFTFDGGGGSSCFLGAGGRYAFMTAMHRSRDAESPSHALVIDLQDGSWRELGRAGDQFSLIGLLVGGRVRAPVPFVALFPERALRQGFTSAANATERLGDWIALDAATLETRATASLATLPDPFRDGELGAACERAVNAVHLADGRRVWRRGRELVTDAPDGGVRVLPDSRLEKSSFARPIGAGMQLFGCGPKGSYVVYDALRERRFEVENSIHAPLVRPGRWIVEREVVAQNLRERCFYDPESGVCSPLPESLARAEFIAVVDDGRLLVLLRDVEDPRERTVALVDPESGACASIELPPWFGGKLHTAWVSARTPGGALVVELRRVRPSHRACYARLDVAERRLVAARDADQPWSELLGCPDEETLILVESSCRLLRARFGEPGVERLFPKVENSGAAR